jgi:penicillin-binding protein 1A
MFGRRKKKKKRSLFKRKGFWIFTIFCLTIVGMGSYYVDKELQPYRDIAQEYDLALIPVVEQPSFILDRKGRELGRIFVQNRHNIPLEEVPPVFLNAVLAQEDQRFYDHAGVDWVGVGRAAYFNYKSGRRTQGAGTLTMQLARNAFNLLNEAEDKGWSGYERKIIEAFLALRIEEDLHLQLESEFPDFLERKKKVKEQIAEYYLNRVPFGAGFYGVRSAALGYFGKEPVDLEAHECASIVACLKNPSKMNPLKFPEVNRKNRDHVLRRMAQEGMITDADRDRLIALPVTPNPNPIRRGKSHLYELIAKQANQLVGEEALSQGGYIIRTTIDLAYQNKVEESLRAQLEEAESRPGYQHQTYQDFDPGSKKSPDYIQGSALMVDHTTGEVLVHVGGRDYAHSQYDFVELGRRPLGTALFPFIYAAAFENGLNPASQLLDEQLNARQLMVGGMEGVVGEWGMEVREPHYEGEITARRGLNSSKISATVGMGVKLGLEKVVGMAKDFGIDISREKLLNRLLVGWDLVSLPEVVMAYTTFPRGGSRVAKTYYILSIQDGNGESRYRSDLSSLESEPSCSEATAFQVHSILNDVMKTGNLASVSDELTDAPFSGGGKSGTPYGFSDAWMVGYNSRITCGVWMGFYKGSRTPIHGEAFAKDLAFPVWKEAMNAAYSDFRGGEIAQPASVVRLPTCRVSGMKPTRYCSEAVEDPETGELTFRSTSYPEYFHKGRDHGICAIHGSGVNPEELATIPTRREALAMIPIKPQAPFLLGFDPYQSETPTLDPEEQSDEDYVGAENLFIVRDRVRGEREALLRLPKPLRFELKR